MVKLFDEYNEIKVGQTGFKVGYDWAHHKVNILKGVVHRIAVLEHENKEPQVAITLRTELPLDEERASQFVFRNLPHVVDEDECYALSEICSPWDPDCINNKFVFFARDKKEVKKLLTWIKNIVFDHNKEQLKKAKELLKEEVNEDK